MGISVNARFLCGFAVLSEALLGGFFALRTAGLVFPSWISSMALVCNICLHVYIVLFIGVWNRIRTFWAWNASCVLVAQVVFAPDQTEPHFATALQAPVFFTAVVVLWSIWPLAIFVGRSLVPNETLAHAYFVSGYSGTSFLLVPKKHIAKFPQTVRDQHVPILCRVQQEDQFRKIVETVVLSCEKRRLEKAFGGSSIEFLWTETVAIDSTLIDVQFRRDEADPYLEYFSTDLPSFWKVLAHSIGAKSFAHVIINRYYIFGNEDKVNLFF